MDKQEFSRLLYRLVVQRFVEHYSIYSFGYEAHMRGHLSKEESTQLDIWAREFLPSYLQKTLFAPGLLVQELVAQGPPDEFVMSALDHVSFYED